MATGFDTSWVVAPPDVPGAGLDEWSRMTGIPPTHPLVGGPGYGAGGSGFEPDAGYSRVVDSVGAAMPGGAPAGPARVRARFNDWRELLDPHSPMLWLLILALGAVSLVHLRLEGRVGPARASAGVG
jgi:hypothetical protein